MIARLQQADPVRLAMALLAPAPARGRLLSLYALNDALAQTALAAREPLAAQMRVRWWVDQLSALDRNAPPPHDLLGALWTAWGPQAAALAPLAAYAALESGWIVTEVGRQPWIVYQILRTQDAVTHVGAGAVWTSFGLLMVLYAALATGAVLVIRGMTKRWRRSELDEAAVPYGPRDPVGAGANRPGGGP